MENTEFVSQLSQFSSLEQLTNLNDTFNSNNKLTQSVHDMMMTNLIGKQLEVKTETLNLSDNKVPEIVYQATEAGHAYAWISQNGTTVRQIDLGNVSSGINGFTWDGKDSLGSTATNGSYDVKVMLENSAGTSNELTTMMKGKATALYYQDGKVMLYMDGQTVNPDDVIAIQE
jgi:flagellar basal-body rod modification protein FlgD